MTSTSADCPTPRVVVALALVTAVVLAGCTAGGCTEGGRLTAVVADPPAAATVTNSSEVTRASSRERGLPGARVGEATVTETLTRVVETGAPVTARLTPRERCRLADALADVPRHAGDRSGYYLRHDGAVVRVRVIYLT